MSSVEDSVVSVVEGFLDALDRHRDALLREFPEFAGLDVVLRGVRSGALARSSRTAEGFVYAVHGRGCRLVGPDGWEVDLDLLPDGREAFDVWRLERFAASAGVNPVPERPALLQQCRELLRAGVLSEPEEGWFSPLRESDRPGSGSSPAAVN
ncbi:DUF6896 domain-containing protein [Streptomyces sp. NPDC002516]